MENLVIRKVKNLIDDFVDETENGFCELVYKRYYADLESLFKDVLEEHCKIVLFGREYTLNARELYDYDRHIASEAWNDHIENQFGDFRYWVEWLSVELDEFVEEFQQWLANARDDEWASDVIVALMSGDIDLTAAVTDWLYDRLRSKDWDYPAV